MIKFTRNNGTFNIDNASLATHALPFIQAIETIGKNASVLKNIVKAVKSSKTNATYDFFVSDGLEDAIVKMALALTTQEKALKACKYDNLSQYQLEFKKWAKMPNAELTQESKDNIKRIIAKAQLLREGVFSKYVHGQVSLNDLKIAFDLTTTKAPVADLDLDAPSVEVEKSAPSAELDLSDLTATLNSLDIDQARLMMEVLLGRINVLETATDLGSDSEVGEAQKVA